MRIVIVGGGRVGKNLLEILQPYNEVAIVEKDPLRCEELASATSALVIQGDGTNPSILDEAGIQDCEALIAATGDGKANLVVCELAKRHKPIKRIIARIVDKGDEVIFRDLGVSDVVWEVDGIVGRIISSLYRMDIIEVEDDVLIISLRISQNDKSIGKKIRELRLPRRGTLLLGIVRLGQWMIPTGEDVVEEGDSVLFLLRRKNLNKVYSQFF